MSIKLSISSILCKFQKAINKGALHVILGNFCTKFLSFFGSIFLVRVLTKADYGILSYYENIMSYAMIIAGFGLSNGVQRFIINADSLSLKFGCLKYALVKGNIYNIILTILFISTLILYPHPYNMSSHIAVGIFLVLCVIFIFNSNVAFSAFRAFFDIKTYSYLALFTSAVLILARVSGAYLGGVTYSVFFRFFFEIVCSIICLYYLYVKYLKGIKAKKPVSSYINSLNNYSLQIMVTDGLWALFMLNDIFILGQFCGDDVLLADYKVALVLPMNLAILNSATMMFVSPYFTRNETNINWVRKNIYQLVVLSFVIIGITVFGISYFANSIVSIMYGDKYLTVVPVMRILLIASLFNNGLRGVIANALSSVGKQRINIFVAIIGIVSQVLLDIILLQEFGLIGLAWASLVAYFIMGITLLLYVKFSLN